MAEKPTSLSIVIRTVDQATARIKAINAQLDAATKPARDFRRALSDLKEKSGLDDVISGFKGVGSAIGSVLSKVAMIGGVVGLAVGAVFHLVSEFDELGDKAERFGVSVDFLSAMRYAAEKAGAPVESLDQGLQTLGVNMGKARAGTGRMVAFLSKSLPSLLPQLKATKSNEQALLLVADAMEKIQDPAKRMALANATLGDPALAPLLFKGAKGVRELTDAYAKLTGGSLQDAADKAGAVDDSLHNLHAATDGVKGALLSGLAPALKIVVDQMTVWLAGHREDIRRWAEDIGKKLPGAVDAVVKTIRSAVEDIHKFVDEVGGLKNVAIGVGLVLAGPLIGSILSLSGALLTALTRAGQLGKALGGLPATAGGAPGGAGAAGGALGPIGLAIGTAYTLSELTGGNKGKDLVDQAQAYARAGKGLRGDTLFDEARRRVGDLPQRDVLADFNPDQDRPDVSAQARSGIDAQHAQIAASVAAAFSAATGGKTQITVDFANAPRGTRVSTDPQSTTKVDLNVGYQMLTGAP